jgi:hypothetical protein
MEIIPIASKSPDTGQMAAASGLRKRSLSSSDDRNTHIRVFRVSATSSIQ